MASRFGEGTDEPSPEASEAEEASEEGSEDEMEEQEEGEKEEGCDSVDVYYQSRYATSNSSALRFVHLFVDKDMGKVKRQLELFAKGCDSNGRILVKLIRKGT